MSNRYLYLAKRQPKIKVAAYVADNPTNKIRWALFAATFTGLFYFFGGVAWRALSGG